MARTEERASVYSEWYPSVSLRALAGKERSRDLAGLWQKPRTVYVDVDLRYWHNKYGISGLQDNLLLPVVVWVLHN